MIVTKTLSTTLSNGVYPATYTWSSDCDSNLTYSNKTGTVNSDGALTTTISYNDTTCLQCNFYISVDNGLGCYGTQDNKGVKSLSCGNLIGFMTCTNYNANVILDGGGAININSTQDGLIEDILFGNHTVQIELFGLTGTDTCFVVVNGQIQEGNGTLFFNVTTDFNTPQIVITFQCIGCL